MTVDVLKGLGLRKGLVFKHTPSRSIMGPQESTTGSMSKLTTQPSGNATLYEVDESGKRKCECFPAVYSSLLEGM